MRLPAVNSISVRVGRTGLGAAILLLAAATPAATQGTRPTMIVDRNSGQCLTAATASLGLRITQTRCVGDASQLFRLTPVNNGYNIINAANGLCISVGENSQGNGAAVVQWTCYGGDDQIWQRQTSGYWLRFAARHSNKCLDIAGASKNDGAWVVQNTCGPENSQRWSIPGPQLRSAWTEPITVPLVPAAMANLPNGNVLLWSARDKFDFDGGDIGRTYTSVFNPNTWRASDRLVTRTQHDMFCPGTTLLPDGRLLVNGGTSPAQTSIFTWNNNSWDAGAPMGVGRGYHSNTLLPDGTILTTGGSWSGDVANKPSEIWSPSGLWRPLAGVMGQPLSTNDPAGLFRSDNHMWLIAQRDGWVFHAGPKSRMSWINTAGSGTVIDAGPRGGDIDAMNGNAVLFEPGKILKVGGSTAYDGGPASDLAYTIDITGGPSNPVITRQVRPMNFPRVFQNSVILPNGEVVVVGGQNTAAGFTDIESVMVPEIWNPVTGRFSPLAAMRVPRNYHSTAILLLDGRVLVGGGGLCGADCGVNHNDVEILAPPYLLRPNGSLALRPAITANPSQTTAGATMSIRTSGSVASFALLRMSAVTHTINNDQRRIPLATPTAGTDTHALTIPADRGTVLPGFYMLFALDSAGVPSMGRVINIR